MLVAHWVRHGQTEWNRAGRIQGQTDSPLTDVGRAQARATAGVLRGRSAVALYTSDLGRARATADALGAALDLKPRPDARLRELHYGILEGKTWREVETEHPDLYRTIRGGSPDVRPPGGESRRDMVGRALEFLADIHRTHADEEVVVVSHGGVVAYVLRTVLQIPYEARPRFRTPNCSISTFIHDGLDWRLQTWSRIDHLEPIADL